LHRFTKKKTPFCTRQPLRYEASLLSALVEEACAGETEAGARLQRKWAEMSDAGEEAATTFTGYMVRFRLWWHY
jgi:hypothetical protein